MIGKMGDHIAGQRAQSWRDMSPTRDVCVRDRPRPKTDFEAMQGSPESGPDQAAVPIAQTGGGMTTGRFVAQSKGMQPKRLPISTQGETWPARADKAPRDHTVRSPRARCAGFPAQAESGQPIRDRPASAWRPESARPAKARTDHDKAAARNRHCRQQPTQSPRGPQHHMPGLVGPGFPGMNRTHGQVEHPQARPDRQMAGLVSGVIMAAKPWPKSANWSRPRVPQALATAWPTSDWTSRPRALSAGPPRRTGIQCRRSSSRTRSAQNRAAGRLPGSLAPKNKPILRRLTGMVRGAGQRVPAIVARGTTSKAFRSAQ